MPSDKKIRDAFRDMSVAYVDSGKVAVESFTDEDALVDFLDQHSADPVTPLVLSGITIPLTLTLVQKKVITKIEKAK